MELSIIIVNFNTWAYTLDCVRSVLKYTAGIDYEIIVVDNASDFVDAEALQGGSPNIKLVLNRQNLGFAGGNNEGIKHATGRYILLLNSDTLITDNVFKILLQFLEAHPQAGAVSPRLVYPDGRHQSVAQRFPSVKYKMIELLRLQKLMRKQTRGRVLLGAFFDHHETLEADWVWAAAMMIPRKVIDQLPEGKLDERYFMYWEDVQWCWDICKLGYKIYFSSDAEIIHIHGGSKGDKEALMRKNGQIFLKRNYPAFHAWCINRLDKWFFRTVPD